MDAIQGELFAYDARREQARAMRRAGHTIREIKTRLGIDSEYKVLAMVTGIEAPNPRLRSRARDDVREQARELRRLGWTYTQIATELGVSKSSCSLWCADLPRPEVATGRKRASTWWPRLALRATERAATKAKAAAQIGELSGREVLLIGAALYWAEGEKDKPYSRRERVNFTNSDPTVVRFFMCWLELLGVPKSDRVFRIQIHESADVVAAHVYWADLLAVDVADFAPPTLKRHNPKTNRRNRNDGYHGCVVIRVRQSAELYRQIEGWWRGIAADAKVEN